MKKKSSITEQTRKRLISSFWNLYKNEDVNTITINKICSYANYERSTFYRYFNNISEILKMAEDIVINKIKELLKKNKSKNNVFISYDKFKNFSKKFGEYITIFYEKENTSFKSKFKELIKNDALNYFNFCVNDEIKRELLFELIFSSVINAYVYWFRHKEVISLEYFVNFTNNTILNGVNSIIELK